MRIGTLFSGIGAPEQAAIRVFGDKFEHVFACEWDKFARQSFKAIYNIEDEHFHVDINDLDGKQYAGKVDCIIGGSPCQDFSIAGLRAGVDGHRGQLIWQYFRIIDEVRPPVFIYENVKGMVSDKNGKTIQDFLEVFRSIGYFCHYEVLNSKDYGIPQNRERVFIVGFLDHEAYYRFQFAPKVPLEKRLKDVLEDNVDEKYYLKKPLEAYNQQSQGNTLLDVNSECNTLVAGTHGYCQGYIQDINRINRTLRVGGGNSIDDKHCFDLIAIKQEGVVGMLDIKDNEQIRRVYGIDGVAPCLQTMQGGNREPKIVAMRGRNPDNPTSRQSGLETVQMIEPNENGTSNCLTSVQKDNLVLEPEYRIRKLTPLECWRLQDFPDEAFYKAAYYTLSESLEMLKTRKKYKTDKRSDGEYVIKVSSSQLYKQAGNSITVAVMEMILRQVEKALIGETNGTLF